MARGGEIETLDEFDRACAADRIRGTAVQDLDLTQRGEQLRAADLRQTVFLGCRFPDDVVNDLLAKGALVFPELPDLPFDPYRATLYTADDLYDGVVAGGRYADTVDARSYAWSRGRATRRLTGTLAASLHDHSIDDALDDLAARLGAHGSTAPWVGVMGGHATRRGDADYRTAVDLGARLALAGRTVVTGGGPGAMEAANLGARFAHHDTERAAAVEAVAALPDFHDDITAWARVALQTLRGLDTTADAELVTLGIPTWFYGHEPPNVFATHIAKYFSNALREDVLLRRCRGGIVYLPGAAGTVQEVFQAATGNYYAADETGVAPMVLVGREHWQRRLPAWPLLDALGEGRAMGRHVHLVDTAEEAVGVLLGGA